jgi:DNA-directed RNA polymerase specialized sigma24 family protein
MGEKKEYSREEQIAMWAESKSPDKTLKIYGLWLESLMPAVFKATRDEDVIQIICLEIWKSFKYFDPNKSSLMTYFHNCINKGHTRMKVFGHKTNRNPKNITKTVMYPEELGEEKEVFFSEDLNYALEFLKKELPPEYLEIYLRVTGGETCQNIAKEKGIQRQSISLNYRTVCKFVDRRFKQDQKVTWAEFYAEIKRTRNNDAQRRIKKNNFMESGRKTSTFRRNVEDVSPPNYNKSKLVL